MRRTTATSSRPPGLNAISAENDPNTRMADIDKFTPAFPDSKFQETVIELSARCSEPTERQRAHGGLRRKNVWPSNPNSLPALLLLANFYSEDTKPGSAAKAIVYCQKVIEVAKADAPDADKTRKTFSGSGSQHDWVDLPEAGQNHGRN
jgi:hypothetical protein